MSLTLTHAAHHCMYQLRNVRVRSHPYSHFFIEKVFPEQFYTDIQDALPSPETYTTGNSNYNGRKFADPLQMGLFDFMRGEDFLRTVITSFLPDFKKRFTDGEFAPKVDLRLVLDTQNYAIGPHTDAAWKVVSLLFYLPSDDSLRALGTSIYTPKDPYFRCPGGPHHKFEPFSKVWTAPFLPNSCFGFFKTDYSFHGVEPITIPCRRDVLLWNLYDLSKHS